MWLPPLKQANLIDRVSWGMTSECKTIFPSDYETGILPDIHRCANV